MLNRNQTNIWARQCCCYIRNSFSDACNSTQRKTRDYRPSRDPESALLRNQAFTNSHWRSPPSGEHHEKAKPANGKRGRMTTRGFRSNHWRLSFDQALINPCNAPSIATTQVQIQGTPQTVPPEHWRAVEPIATTKRHEKGVTAAAGPNMRMACLSVGQNRCSRHPKVPYCC